MSLKPSPPNPNIPGDVERYQRDIADMQARPRAWGVSGALPVVATVPAKFPTAPITYVDSGTDLYPQATIEDLQSMVPKNEKLSPETEGSGTSSLPPEPPAQPSAPSKRRGRPPKNGG